MFAFLSYMCNRVVFCCHVELGTCKWERVLVTWVPWEFSLVWKRVFVYSRKSLNCTATTVYKASRHVSEILLFFFSAGRTFPTHPYFSAQLGAGQLSLFNLLKAYSLLDKEVGYCQGISFVAGVLLLHMSEEQAFEMLKFLMYDLGFRKQYRPDMMSLQVRL